MRPFALATLLSLSLALPLPAQVTTVITNGQQPFAEGILLGYVVQSGGRTLCADPYVIGRYISCSDTVRVDGQVWQAPSRQQVWAETNGTLGAMVVVDKAGRPVCQSPAVSIRFRGPTSYVLCTD